MNIWGIMLIVNIALLVVAIVMMALYISLDVKVQKQNEYIIALLEASGEEEPDD